MSNAPRNFEPNTRTRILVFACVALALYLVRDELLGRLGMLRSLAGNTRRGDAALLAAFATLNLVVLVFAMRPSIGLYFLGRSHTRERLTQDMDVEQANMPEVLSIVSTALSVPEQRRAAAHLFFFFLPLLGLPLWWSWVLNTRLTDGTRDACLLSLGAADTFLGFRFFKSPKACGRLGVLVGNLAGGGTLFLSAVFFRSRLQIALRGFSRFQKRK